MSKFFQGIYMVANPQDGALKHVVTIKAYWMTKEDGLFFLVQNTYMGDPLEVAYHDIMIITYTCDMF